MSRRRPGVAGVLQKNRNREQFQIVGEQTKEQRKEEMKRQMAIFKTSLEEFALKHKQDIRKDPNFRAQFQKMCSTIGVDPLSSNKGYWTELLGIGNFYYELAVQIVEVCLATRSMNGGLMDLAALLKYVRQRRGSIAEPVSQDDIKVAINKIKVLGNGFELLTIGSQTLVKSIPQELNTDKSRVLELARRDGFVSEIQLREDAGWTELRIASTLRELLKDGLAMVDDGDPSGVRLFWFPCVKEIAF
eukprot:g1487.t1